MNDDEIRERRTFFGLGPREEERLRDLAPAMAEHADAIVDAFYRLLREQPPTANFLRDDASLAHLARTQREYLLQLVAGTYDAAYVEQRRRIGTTHQRIGMPPAIYLGAYARYLELMFEHVAGRDRDDPILAACTSLLKVGLFDAALAIDSYIAAEEEARRHQAAKIRELSIPVIELDDSILLVPLVGEVDDERGNLLMETVLTRITERSARAVIVDIAGAAVVDTNTADRLVKAAAAVQLVGAHAVVTGVGAEVARTLVQLGFDVGALHTRSRLSDGVALARTLVARGPR